MTALEYTIANYAGVAPGSTIIELGVGDGTSLRQAVAASYDRESSAGCAYAVYGFDSFDGLPENWTPWFKKGHFAQETVPQVPGSTIISGLFKDTLPRWCSEGGVTISVLHVDCDLYRSAMQSLCILNHLIAPGTMLVFDEIRNQCGYEWNEEKALADWKALFDREV